MANSVFSETPPVRPELDLRNTVTPRIFVAATRMLRENAGSTMLGKASTRELYWTVGQMVAHLTSNGCNVEAGDLFGTGTVSGDATDALGSLFEITRAGRVTGMPWR